MKSVQKGLALSLFGDKRKGFAIEKLDYFKNKARCCDPFDIKLMDYFINAIFAYHNPSVHLLPVKRGQTVCVHLKQKATYIFVKLNTCFNVGVSLKL